ncbi:multimeric flavodoxin WrbA [Paenibacillus shirakamiensis]|uniref:Multimeric flavodoxin WrbA n=1 Tax=Paenibacillus shirakamiensis TaxID=1265935 RepID=A0ABS4JIQ8_9BACL|nr:flavodoxin family protein [Paenibacillus shirakamiensis]MBP2001585.1 multimeric flavodoxin WrbA [Paenibacillus shirakamiensis]
MSVVVLQGSARAGGNTEELVELVLQDIPHTHVILRDHEIQPIVDQRHAEGGFQTVEDDYDALIQQVLEHDILIFATPVYWYGISGTLKTFVDRWSQSLRSQEYDFKSLISGKKAYVVVVGGDDPRIKALPLLQQLKYTFDFVGLSFEGYVIGKASKPGDIASDERALHDAKGLNAQLKAVLAVKS